MCLVTVQRFMTLRSDRKRAEDELCLFIRRTVNTQVH